MAAERYDKKPLDYVLLILTPALIMLLVGSLVFFLIEVLYAGTFKDRLRLGFACYVFGAVLVARISMMADIAARAPIYGIVLAVLAWLLLQLYIHYDEDSKLAPFSALINLVLIGIVWWSTHRLTWDCTRVESEGDDTNDTGLLEAAGLEPKSVRVEDKRALVEAEAKDPPGVFGWWARYRRFSEQRKKTRPLGVWVVYFSLATLPIFGLGQAILAVDDVDRRTNVFWFMAIYVASGLALLLTTCFLSLRRYLRRRNVEMPVKMTATWLTTGVIIIVVLLIVGALVPRPKAEYSVLDVTPFRSERKANEFSAFKDSAGKDKGQPGGRNEDQKDGAEGKDSGNRDGKNSGKQQDKSENGGDKGEKDKGGDKSKKDGKDGKPNSSGKDGQDGKDGSSKGDNSKQDSSKTVKSPESSSNNPLTKVTEALGPLGQILKWVVFAVLALVVLFLVFRHGLKFLANFTQWARDLLASLRKFWEGLFGGAKKDKTSGRESEDEGEVIEEALPFSAYRNPFDDGTATQRSQQELLRYTFAALEAWARDRDVARLPHETALEFATRLSKEAPGFADALRRFIGLYVRAEYARGGLPGNVEDVVRQFWDQLETPVKEPLPT
jgi:Domain of unknown function (DUF4129)